jgi:hypothetical protein
MGPRPACRQLGDRQEKGRGSFAARSRSRVCLLKGCGGCFVPSCWSQRYCSTPCRRAADAWRRRKAAREYRRSEKGKAKRAEQSKRRRARQVQVQGGDEVSESDSADDSTQLRGSEGHHPFEGVGDFCCDRPGCYVLFDRSPRSPSQRFCTSVCYRAMRSVRVREARWRARAVLRSGLGCTQGLWRPG